MSDDDLRDRDNLRDEIARLELQIETLAESIERCRKLDLAAKVAIAGGAVWLLATVLGAVDFVTPLVLAAIAAGLGGTVLLGSNSSTWKQAAAAQRRAEARRAELIGQIEMRAIPECEP